MSRASKPVLLKRGMSATLEEWLMAAEYVMAGGNYNVILCERGVRTFSDHSRNTLDLSVIPPAKSCRICRSWSIPATAPAGATTSRRWPWPPWPPERTAC